MKKRIMALLLTAVLLLTACGPKSDPEQPAQQENQSGAGDMDVYDRENLFLFGMIPAEAENGDWGYLNEQGGWAIEPAFDSASVFYPNGCAVVREGRQTWYVIDRSGERIIEEAFSYIYPFSKDDIARAEKKDGTYGYLILKDEGYEWREDFLAGDFNDDGLAVGSTRLDRDAAFIIDTNFEYVLEPQEGMWIGEFSNGLARAKLTHTDENNKIILDRKGYVNTRGEWVIDIPLDWGYTDFGDNGIAVVTEKIVHTYYKFIDTTGAVVAEIDPEVLSEDHPDISEFAYSDWARCVVSWSSQSSHYEYGYINAEGERFPVNCVRRDSDDFVGSIRNGYLVDGPLVYDDTGALVAEYEDHFFLSDYYADGYAVVKVTAGGQLGFMTTDGEFIPAGTEEYPVERIRLNPDDLDTIHRSQR